MSAAQPGWYPDPAAGDGSGSEPPAFRWWDGASWTDAVGSSVSAPAPDPRSSMAAIGRTPRLPGPRTRAAATIGLGVALVTVLGVIAGLVIWREPSGRERAATQVAEASPGLGWQWVPTGRLDEATRRVSLDSSSMVLPGPPYEVYERPMWIPQLINEFWQANAVVHRRYDGQRDWSAVVGIAHLRVSPAQARDLEAAAEASLREIAQRFFAGRTTKVTEVSTADHSVDGRPGMTLTATVTYRVPGLASRYDEVVAILVRLDDGSVIAAFSSVPDDSPSEVKAQAAVALASLSIS